MKTKKLLLGLIEMNATMYNILYTLLCVCFLIGMFVVTSFGLTNLENEGIIFKMHTFTHVGLVWAIILFIGGKILSAKNYA